MLDFFCPGKASTAAIFVLLAGILGFEPLAEEAGEGEEAIEGFETGFESMRLDIPKVWLRSLYQASRNEIRKSTLTELATF